MLKWSGELSESRARGEEKERVEWEGKMWEKVSEGGGEARIVFIQSIHKIIQQQKQTNLQRWVQFSSPPTWSVWLYHHWLKSVVNA